MSQETRDELSRSRLPDVALPVVPLYRETLTDCLRELGHEVEDSESILETLFDGYGITVSSVSNDRVYVYASLSVRVLNWKCDGRLYDE